MSASVISVPRIDRRFASREVTISAVTAGMTPTAMMEVRGRLKASAAAMALGLGLMTLPARTAPSCAISTPIL